VGRFAQRVPFAGGFARRLVVGERVEDAVGVAVELAATGLLVTVDHVGDLDPRQGPATDPTTRYLDAIRLLAAAGLAGDDAPGVADVSVRFGVLEGRADAVADAVDGDAVDAVAGDTGAAEQAGDAGSPWSGVSPWEAENAGDGQDVVLARARTICDAAAAVGVTVTFEATDHADVDRMLTVVRELRPAIPSVGVTVQAHLRRSEADCRELAAARARVRLAPGTGVAPPALVYGSRLDVDRSYVRCLRSLMAGGGYPMVATHDPRLIDLAGALAAQWSRAGDSYEYQLPHGVQSGIRARLLDAGERVRVRVPYGTAWYGYLLRRTAERPASAASILRRRGR